MKVEYVNIGDIDEPAMKNVEIYTRAFESLRGHVRDERVQRNKSGQGVVVIDNQWDEKVADAWVVRLDDGDAAIEFLKLLIMARAE